MKKTFIAFLVLSIFLSCGKETPTEEKHGADGQTRLVAMSARFSSPAKATVATSGAVAWADGDQLGVYTSAAAIRTFDITEHSGATATFVANLPVGEEPTAIAVYPKNAFKSFSGGVATVTYPSVYTYADEALFAPMAAVPVSGSLPFAHLGGLISIDCDDVPTEAASLRLTASGRKITGEFTFTPGAGMNVSTESSASGNTVTVSFTPGTLARRFNIPVPSGTYPALSVSFYNALGALLYTWDLLEDVTVSAGDMFLREPSYTTINGTAILEGNTRVGLITDSSTGAGISGVPVTDGYTYTLTDANGVYQFVAHEDARCVYPSVPAGYEVPLGADGEPLFWKTNAYRNDFSLTPRSGDWSNFSVLAFTDVHFWNKGASQSDEVTKYEDRVLSDLNDYIATLPSNLIILNTGDVVTNVTAKLADSRTEFAKIKKGGVTVPMFPVIGNHDFNNTGTSTLSASTDWFNVYGPLDYSFNVGNAHVVCINNMQSVPASSDGVYGHAMPYEKGLTDAQWAWLQEDLATVSGKSGKLLLLCMHCPVKNNDWAHAGDIRNLLKTFGESHIFTGHNHYNEHRQFTASWNGLTGRTSEEHNMQPLGGLWRSRLSNDGVPYGYHVFSVSGGAITSQVFKAIGSDDASEQFRIYDGGASYHAAVTDATYGKSDMDGKLYFDWNTLWESSEGIETEGKMIVRVFDAGTRGLECKVYYNDGSRHEMTRVSASHRDQCAFSFFWNSGSVSLNSDYASAYMGGKSSNYWYYDAPVSGSGWKVEVEFTEPSGTRTYKGSTVQTDYSGFAW